MNLLAIETSCDETSAAIIQDGSVLSNITYSQTIHNEYGGVIPEIASQEHVKKIVYVTRLALKESMIKLTDIDALAVTYGPGLMGALLVGVNFIKAISVTLKIPFIGVNHLEGHLFSNFIKNDKIRFPYICLLVSGGHTQIWKVLNFDNYQILGSSIDDAAGEAFDKGAKILGLGYPGGPEIEKVSKHGDVKYFAFPRPNVKKSKYDFSFSGLKTSLLYYCESKNDREIKKNLNNIAASYQEAIIDTLLIKLSNVLANTDIRYVTVCGGVAANGRFREKAKEIEKKFNASLHFPKLEYCTDNAAMVGIAGFNKLINGITSELTISPIPNLSVNKL